MTSTREHLAGSVRSRARRPVAEVAVLATSLLLVAAAHVAGLALEAGGAVLLLPFPPIFAEWDPHASAASIAAVAVVVAALRLQAVCARLPWRRLVAAGWALGLAWILSLAAVDGNWTTRLLSPHEYLHDLSRVGDPWTFLRTFTDHIVDVPDAWTTHVSAHPPLATLFFWFLDRAGLGGPVAGALACMLLGSLALPAFSGTLRTLGADAAARQLVPFGVVFPGALWIGVSGDAVFLGVASLGLVAACAGATRRWPAASLVGGVLLGATPYLSYGLVLFGPVVAVAAWLSVRRVGRARAVRAWLLTAAGAAGVAVAFTVAGFDWLHGLALTRVRYDQGIADARPYGYFVWANLAAVVVCASPVVALALLRAVRVLRGPGRSRPDAAPAWLAMAGVLAIAVADLSGLSKAETERIWLTFTAAVWCATGLSPRAWRRPALLGAAIWALAVNHLLLTEW